MNRRHVLVGRLRNVVAERLERRSLLSSTQDHQHDGGCDHGETYVGPAVLPRSPNGPNIDPLGLPTAARRSGGSGGGDAETDVEPNNTAATATPVTVSSTNNAIRGTIGVSGDLDYYSFTLSQRAGVFFDIDAREAGLSNIDSALDVYRSTETSALGTNDDGDDFETFALNDTAATARNFDAALYLDLAPGDYVVRVSSFSGLGAYDLKIRADASYAPTVPTFSSLPGASDTLYLDFDGHSATDAWGTYSIAPFDFSGDASEWTPAERAAIENVWRVVAEDYAPFNINVTTSYTGSFNDGVGHRQIIGNSNGSELGYTGTLGVAFRPSYASNGSANNVSFTFANSFGYVLGDGGTSGQIGAKAVEMGNTTSHEFGHALGLQHYGASNAQLNGIMHTPDFGLSRERWKTGLTKSDESPVNFQTDVDIISGASNTFGYRLDDHGDTRPSATVLTAAAGSYSAAGIIGRTSDVDVFRFTASGPTTLAVTMLEHVANLDAEIRLYDAAGTLVASHDPSTSIFANLSLTLAAGTYYVEVASDGEAGEIGQYGLSISAPVVVASGTPGAPDLLASADSGRSDTDDLTNRDNSAGRTLTFSVAGTVVGATVSIYADGVLIGSETAVGNLTTVVTNGSATLANGVRSFTARQTEPSKTASDPSASLGITIDTVAPFALGSSFDHTTAPKRVPITFSEDVGASLTGAHLALLNRTTGTTTAAASVTYATGTNVATFLLPSTLADGDYSASLPAAGEFVPDAAGNALAPAATLDFFLLTGDVNRDRAVDFSDLVALAQNYNKPNGATYAEGDLDLDGQVGFSDLVILAQNYNRALVLPAPERSLTTVARKRSVAARVLA